MSLIKRLRIFKDGRDISDEVHILNQKALPGGWSFAQVEHDGVPIGFLDCGALVAAPGYTAEVSDLAEPGCPP